MALSVSIGPNSSTRSFVRLNSLMISICIYAFIVLHVVFCIYMWWTMCLCGCAHGCIYLGVYACVCVGQKLMWASSTSPPLSLWDSVIYCTVGHRFRYTGWPVNPQELLSLSLVLKGYRCVPFCQAFYMSAGGSASLVLGLIVCVTVPDW